MTRTQLKTRTKRFALDVIRFCEATRGGDGVRTCRRQLVRSGTSVGASYRAACRARSRREFVAKLGVVEEEADESMYWLELLAECDADRIDRSDAQRLHREANELLSIVVATIRTTKANGL